MCIRDSCADYSEFTDSRPSSDNRGRFAVGAYTGQRNFSEFATVGRCCDSDDCHTGNRNRRGTATVDSCLLYTSFDKGKEENSEEKEEEKEEELEAILFSRSAVTNSFFNKLIPGKPEKKVNISELETVSYTHLDVYKRQRRNRQT